MLFNCAKSLGTQPKHGDGVPDLTNDSEPAFRRLALLKAGSEGRPRNFLRFPPLIEIGKIARVTKRGINNT